MTEPTNQDTKPEVKVENQPKAASLSLNDLRALQRIIDVCSTRGAFKAEELTSIGVIYDRVTAFLDATEATVSAAKPTDAKTPPVDKV